MKKVLKFFAFSLGLLLTQFAFSQNLPGPVVDTTWLASNLDKVQVLDVRSNVKSFTTQPELEVDAKSGKKVLSEVGGHIAGARLLDTKLMRTDRMMGGVKVKYMIPEKTDFEKLMQSIGIDAGKPIVLISMGTEVAEVNDALRMYWQLKVYGEDKIAVLDGGMAAWLLEGREFEVENIAARNGNWTALNDRTELYFASSEDVKKSMQSKTTSLVDSRDLKSYLGLVKRDYVGGYGHIEGAKLFPTELLLKTAGGALKFMSANTYRGLMQAQGIDTTAAAITYCNSGHLSSGTWFVLSELLANKATKLYDGSLHQWTLEKNLLSGGVPLN